MRDASWLVRVSCLEHVSVRQEVFSRQRVFSTTSQELLTQGFSAGGPAPCMVRDDIRDESLSNGVSLG